MRFFYVENSLDHYSFGMLMPERFGGGDYRYSFQGQEADNEIKGKGNSVNYKYRMHDARLGRFFAVDPLSAKYPYNSPYAFSENRVVDAIELEGLENVVFHHIHQRVGGGTTKIGRVVHSDLSLEYEYSREVWYFEDLKGKMHIYANPYPSFGTAGTARLQFMKEHSSYFTATRIVDYEESANTGTMVSGTILMLTGIATTFASYGTASSVGGSMFFAGAGLITGTYAAGMGMAKIGTAIEGNLSQLNTVNSMPTSPLGAFGRAMDLMSQNTGGRMQSIGELANAFIFFKQLKWNDLEEISKELSISSSKMEALMKSAQNGDAVAFLYSIFSLAANSILEVDKKILEAVANDIENIELYYNAIKEARNE